MRWIGVINQRAVMKIPELFFPVGNTGPALTQIEEAKKVCNRCIVKEPCLGMGA